MSAVLDRFLRYDQYDTQSDENSSSYPSTGKQLALLKDLAEELRGLGLTDAVMDEHGYVTATVPATSRKQVPTIAFIAHDDEGRRDRTADERAGEVHRVAPVVAIGDSCTAMRAPGARRNCPSVTTVSPGRNPDAMTDSAPAVRATFTGRTSTVLSFFTT